MYVANTDFFQEQC